MLNNQALRPMTRDELRSVDQRAVSEFGMSGLVLMENAGHNAATIVAERVSSPPQNVCIVCGKGNNAGDGFVIARHLELAGFNQQVFLLEDPKLLSHDAKVNYDILANSGHCMPVINDDSRFADLVSSLTVANIVVDALAGTGLHGSARGQIAEGIRCINQAKTANKNQRVVSIDIPSGMDCDSGCVGELAGGARCVRADLTITFVATKVGFHLANSSKYLGEVRIADIGAPLKLLKDFIE